MGKVMKVFKTLINELFGTKREYKVEGLGIFTCKVCDWWRDKCCLWSGAVQLPFYSVETLVLIEGDASAPFSRQLLELQVLLQNWVPRDIPKIIKFKATNSLRVSCLFCIFKHSPQKTV